MAYIYGLIIVSLFFAVMHFFTELDLKQKMGATVLTLSLVMGALYYNTVQNEKAQHLRDVMLRFNQGKRLQCGDLEVDKKNFSLSVGTQTFIAREQTPYSGKMVAASECE